jgi:uncharacterized DUF497 family protein
VPGPWHSVGSTSRAAEVFAGRHLTARDLRHVNEERFITLGRLDARMVVLVWTPRGEIAASSA